MTKEEFKFLKKEDMIISFSNLKDDYSNLFNEQLQRSLGYLSNVNGLNDADRKSRLLGGCCYAIISLLNLIYP